MEELGVKEGVHSVHTIIIGRNECFKNLILYVLIYCLKSLNTSTQLDKDGQS